MAYTKKEMPGIMLYWGTLDSFSEMSGEQVKQMLHAMRMYAQTGENPDFSGSPAMKMAWCFLRDFIDRDKGKYEEIREKRAKSGAKGGKKSGETRRANADNPSPFGLE